MIRNTRLLIGATVVGLALSGHAGAQTFRPVPLLADRGVDALTRDVARQTVDRDLLGSTWATVVVGRVDVYERFPYLESRWFQIVSDPAWNRLLHGELDGALGAHDGRDDTTGPLLEPRGLAVDERGRVYVADSGNHRVVAYDTVTEYGTIRLVPAFQIEGLHRPWDVAYSDGGTPWQTNDDRLYVADTGANRVVAYALANGGPRLAAVIGELGSGVGMFAGPTSITAGRRDSVHAADVYVADAHSGRLVHLRDEGDSFAWVESVEHPGGIVTSLDTDRWGSIYATTPRSGFVTKLSPELFPLASFGAGLVRPRAFHGPFAARTDHRDGSVAWVGRGEGMLLEQWTGTSGLRLVQLGVEVRDLAVRDEGTPIADFVLTDRANAVAEVIDPATGGIVARAELGALAPGRHAARLDAETFGGAVPAGDWVLRVTSRSLYEGTPSAQAEASFRSTGGPAVALPSVATLMGSAPSPFRSSTRVEFAVPAGPARSWRLTVHDVTGRRVTELGAGRAEAGIHSVSWNGRDAAGRPVSAGIYLYRLEVGSEVATGKVVHLR